MASLKKMLQDYVGAVNVATKNRKDIKDISPDTIKSLRKQHQKLTDAFALLETLDKTKASEDVREELDSLPLDLFRVAKFLQFGMAAQHDFIKDILFKISKSTSEDFAHVAFQEYLKKPETLYAVHRNKEFPEGSSELKELAHTLGGMLGVEVSEHLASSVKLERLGHVKAYVAAGNNINDIEEYRKRKNDPQFLDKFPSAADFLFYKINTSSKNIKYRNDPAQGLLTAALLDNSQMVLGSQDTEKSWTSDAAYFNEKTKEIHFCMSSMGTLPNESQLESAYLIKKALENTIESGADLELFECTVHSHLLHGGFVPVEMIQGQSSKYIGHEFVENLKSTEMLGGDDLSRLLNSYVELFYLAEKNPSVNKTEVFMQSNMSSLGADTLAFYHEREKCLSAENPIEAFGLLCLSNLAEVTTLLAEKTNLALDSRGYGHLEKFLDAVCDATSNHLISFGVTEKSPSLEKTIDGLVAISKNLNKLHEKIKDQELSAGTSGIPQKIWDTAGKFRDEASVLYAIKGNSYKFKEPVYSSEQFNDLNEKKKTTVASFGEATEENFETKRAEIGGMLAKSMAYGNFKFLQVLVEELEEAGEYVPSPVRNHIVPSMVAYSEAKDKNKRLGDKHEHLGYADRNSMAICLKNAFKNPSYFWECFYVGIADAPLCDMFSDWYPVSRLATNVTLSDALSGASEKYKEIIKNGIEYVGDGCDDHGLLNLADVVTQVISLSKNDNLLKSVIECSTRTYKKRNQPK